MFLRMFLQFQLVQDSQRADVWTDNLWLSVYPPNLIGVDLYH